MDEVHFAEDPRPRREQLLSFADADIDMEEDIDPDETPKVLDDEALEVLHTESEHLFAVKMQHVPECIPRPSFVTIWFNSNLALIPNVPADLQLVNFVFFLYNQIAQADFFARKHLHSDVIRAI